jgi:hypothetical protein
MEIIKKRKDMVMWWHLKVVTSRECGFSQTQGHVS